MNGFERTIDRTRFVRMLFVWLLAGELLFVLVDYVFNRSHWIDSVDLRHLFNIAREDSLHNFVSSVQNLAVAGVVLVLYLHARRTAIRRLRFEWGVAFAFFLWLGLDDGSAIHERVGSALESELSFFPSYAWQIVFVPIFAAAALVTLHVVWSQRRVPWTLALFVGGLACFVLGVVLDYVEGREGLFDDISSGLGIDYSTVSHYNRVLEEFVEDLGSTFFLLTFLRLLLVTAAPLRLLVRQTGQTDASSA